MGQYGALICERIPEKHPEGCAGCGKTRPPKRSVWCSEACSAEWWRRMAEQHDWADARDAALARDGHRCVRCGAGHFSEPEPHLRDYAAAGRSRAEIRAAFERCREDHRAWSGRRALYRLEVNHIEPRVGAGYGRGCWNHSDNLETLCHRCHVLVTNEQRMARRGKILAA